jgi:signal transduction histidine kinase
MRRAQRAGTRLRIATVLAAVALSAAHLGVTYAILGELDERLIVLTGGVALIVIAAAFWYVGALTDERERQALDTALLAVLLTPRNISGTARTALTTLEREGVARAGLIALADDTDSAMFPLATIGYPEGWVVTASPAPLPWADARPVLRREREPHPWLTPVLDRLGKRPWVAKIPLTSTGDPIGLLLLATDHPGILREPRVLEVIGEQLSGALDHAALYEAAYQRERDLEELDQRRREFMAAISHEVRTPLTAIQAFVELLQLGRSAMDETAEQLVESLSHGVDRLNALVTDLIDLGRQGGADYEVHPEEVDVNRLLEHAAEMLRPAFLLRDQTVHLELPDASVYAVTDLSLLEQTVLNLLSNANRHAPFGGEITLGVTHAPEGRARVEIRDTGPGIVAEDRERIFEPYYRVRRNGAPDVPGSGLGLAVARRMVDALGGRIWVEDGAKGGACVCIEVRASSQRDAQPTPAPRSETAATPTPTPRGAVPAEQMAFDEP